MRRNKGEENRLVARIVERNNPDYYERRPYAISSGAAHRRCLSARRRGATVANLTAREWNLILRHYDWRCAYCGCRTPEPLTMDHRIPLCRGGEHSATNVVPACASCNASKGSKLVSEWRRD